MNSQCLLGSSAKTSTSVRRRRPYLGAILAFGVVLMACGIARGQATYPPAIQLLYGANYGFTDDQGPVTLIRDPYGYYTGTYTGLITYGYPTIDYEDLGDYQWEDVGYWDYSNISGYDEDGNPIPTWVSDWQWVWVSNWQWVNGVGTATAGFTFYVSVTLNDSGYLDYYAWAQAIYDTRSYEYSTTIGVSSGIFDFSSINSWMYPANTDGTPWTPPSCP